MSDEHNQDSISTYAKANEKKVEELTQIHAVKTNSSKNSSCSSSTNTTSDSSADCEKPNLTRSFSLDAEIATQPAPVNDEEPRYLAFLNNLNTAYHPTAVKYDFQDFGRLPLVIMPNPAMTPGTATAEPKPSQQYYAINDSNIWSNGLADPIAFNTMAPAPTDYFVEDNQRDYFYPIVCGMRNGGSLAATDSNRLSDVYGNASNLGVGYASPYISQPFTMPYSHYTTLQPQNFYANMPPQYVCKRDCIPTTRVPTTRCTKKPGSPIPIIAWENNNTCCCELYGSSCGASMPMDSRRPLYGPCKPPPTTMSNYRNSNSNSLYCNGRRRKREYYLSAPKARQRLQRETDRCRITTTTTPKPKPWPTNYPIKFRLQKSMDMAAAPTENQVNNLRHSSPRNPSNKLFVHENELNNMKIINENTHRCKAHARVSKNVPETVASKMRKKHNEVKMQELQETLEIALEKMNQEMNE